jgi:hypothetical protein
MNSLVSISDVARVAGVHRSTVSRVLAGQGAKGRICPATQARILTAASQLGYVRKPAIRFSVPVAMERSQESEVRSQNEVTEPVPEPGASEPVIPVVPMAEPVAVAEPSIPAEPAVEPVLVQSAEQVAETGLTAEPEIAPETSQGSEKPPATENTTPQ